MRITNFEIDALFIVPSINQLLKARKPVTADSIVQHLQQTKKIDIIGGERYVRSFLDDEHLNSLRKSMNAILITPSPSSKTGIPSSLPSSSSKILLASVQNGKLIGVPASDSSLSAIASASDYQFIKCVNVPANAAFVDTVSFTFKKQNYCKAFSLSQPFHDYDLVLELSKKLEEILGYPITKQYPKGKNNYENSYELGNGWGFLAIGGVYQRDTVQVYIDGQGCMSATEGFERRIYEFLERVSGKYTRLDLAADFHRGEYSVDKAFEDHLNGLFKMPTSINPRSEKRGCWDYEALGVENTGRTYYIGTKSSGKLFRVYEKGLQLAHEMKKDERFKESFVSEYAPWARVELQLGTRNREIPLDAILYPAQYLAGSAPALSFLHEEQKRIPVKKKTLKATLETAKQFIQNSCGKWLYAFQELYCLDEQGNPDDNKFLEFIRSLMVESLPKRLAPFADAPPSLESTANVEAEKAQKKLQKELDDIEESVRYWKRDKEERDLFLQLYEQFMAFYHSNILPNSS